MLSLRSLIQEPCLKLFSSVRFKKETSGANIVKVKGCANAFTMVEILLVLVILGIIAGLTIPNFSHTYKSLELKKSAEDLTFLMRYAQSRAVTKNLTMRLAFDSNFETYWLEQEKKEGPPQASQKVFERFNGRLGRTFDIPRAMKVECEKQFFNFYPDGTIEKGKIYLYSGEQCFTISTREQRAHVHLFNIKVE